MRFYEDGFIPPFRPLRYAIRDEEYFVPWDKVIHIESITSIFVVKEPNEWVYGIKWKEENGKENSMPLLSSNLTLTGDMLLLKLKELEKKLSVLSVGEQS